MRRLCLCLLVLILLVGCGASDPTPQTGGSQSGGIIIGAPTYTPEATRVIPTITQLVPTQGKIALTADGITSTLLLSGDLPASWSKGESFTDNPVDYAGPPSDVVIIQELIENGSKFASGDVKVWVFKDTATATTAYKGRVDLIQRNLDKGVSPQNAQIGDSAILFPATGNLVSIIPEVVFRRCRMVFEVSVGGRGEEQMTNTYASRLDERFKSSAC